MLYDIDKDELVVTATEGLGEPKGRRAALALGPRGEAAIRNKTIVLSDRWAEDPLISEPEGAVMFLSSRHDRRLFAVLQVHRPAGPVFDEDEQHTVAYVSAQLAGFLADHSKRIGFDDEAEPKR
jgi:hypothetical protein